MPDLRIPRDFAQKFLKAEGIEHDPADGSVGIQNDTWYVDSDTLARMLSAYLVDQLERIAKAVRE